MLAVRTSDFDGEVGKDPGLAIEVCREVGSTMGTADSGGGRWSAGHGLRYEAGRH